MQANDRLQKAIASAQDKKNRHKLSTLGLFMTETGPAIKARCADCYRYVFQFANGTVGGTATDRECGDRVAAK